MAGSSKSASRPPIETSHCMLFSYFATANGKESAVVSAKRYLSERGGEILNSAATVPLAFIVLPYRLVQNDLSHNIAQYLDTPSLQ